MKTPLDFEPTGQAPRFLISKRQRKFSQKKFLILLLGIPFLSLWGHPVDAQINKQGQRVSVVNLSLNTDDEKIAQAFEQNLSGIWVKSQGLVEKILADDQKGSAHQRFIVRLSTGQTLLISHNIDLAPRVPDIQAGKEVRFYGRYEWNSKGGVIHWTHHDPEGKVPGGWLEYEGHLYQ